MDLSSPLSSLMNPLEAAALTVLARADAEFTGRRVAQLAGGQRPASIHAALQRLADVGLVVADPQPHATMYRANRAHLLWASVEAGLDARKELRRRLTDYFEARSPEGASLLLYGSLARGESGPDSDLDLAVILPDAVEIDEGEDFTYQLAELIESWTGNVAQINAFRHADIRRHAQSGEPLLASWLREGVLIAGSLPPELRAAG